MTTSTIVPSADSNPFSTCWTRPGALSYPPSDRARIEQCVELLHEHRWRGQILGPHGAGKSTLLRALGLEARRLGIPVSWLRAGSGGTDNRARLQPGQNHLVLIDSFEEFGRWRRWHWRRRQSGLVVTSHRSIGLPTLAVLQPTLQEVLSLFEHLTAGRQTPVTFSDAAACFRRRSGNVREVWFDLYDLHERRTRTAANPARVSA